MRRGLRRTPSRRASVGVLILASLASPASAGPAPDLPFGPGERVALRITYAYLLAGRASLRVTSAEHQGRPVLRFISEAKSQGFFAWLFGFRVDDRTVATWDPETGCSLGIEKRLREGRARRDQVVTIDPAAGTAEVRDPKIQGTYFEVGPCVLDVLSAFFTTRIRGVIETEPLLLPVFDNGRRYQLAVRLVGRQVLDLPPPLGKKVRTVIVEPLLAEGTGLFVKKGRLLIWLTDDERRIPVRMRSKVAIGSVSADLEAYEPPGESGRSEARPEGCNELGAELRGSDEPGSLDLTGFLARSGSARRYNGTEAAR